MKKIRTRGHIIADLSVNFFEKVALLKGHSVQRIEKDYGYDLILFSYDINGEIEPGYVVAQLKATDNLEFINHETTISFPIEKRDLCLWLKEFHPVIFVVYDAKNNKGYWVYIQEYFQTLNDFNVENVNRTVNIHIPKTNRIGKKAMAIFCNLKYKLFSEIKANL